LGHKTFELGSEIITNFRKYKMMIMMMMIMMMIMVMMMMMIMMIMMMMMINDILLARITGKI
jgi:hypothetical protein